MATKLNIKRNWDKMISKLKQKYAILTDDDSLFVKGKEEELLGLLEKTLVMQKKKYAMRWKNYNFNIATFVNKSSYKTKNIVYIYIHSKKNYQNN